MTSSLLGRGPGQSRDLSDDEAAVGSVLVGVDGRATSPDVVVRALAEAVSSGRPLEVLHAWHADTAPSPAVVLDDLPGLARHQAAAETLLHSVLDGVLDSTGRPGASVTTAARRGQAGDVLVRRGRCAALLVVGARSGGPVSRAGQGSTTDHALRRATCPVMVVPPTASPGAYRRVVVGVDRRDHAGAALAWAVDAAVRHACPLLVVHALPLTVSPSSRASQERDARHQGEVRDWLQEAVASATRSSPELDVDIELRDGSPFDVLTKASVGGDLLVLGSRQHAGLEEALLGSVAVACAQDDAGVVVVVRTNQQPLGAAGRPGRSHRDGGLVTSSSGQAGRTASRESRLARASALLLVLSGAGLGARADTALQLIVGAVLLCSGLALAAAQHRPPRS